jgi:hypothetical protein
MNRFTEQFKNSANAALTATERARVRAVLEQAMLDHPAVVRSPYFSPFFVFSSRTAYAFAALLLIIGVTGSSAYAAESAIPGDLLYSVKVNVNEPVALALAVTPQSKAETHAAIATTRLAEAQSLASQGTLTASTSAELADSFETNLAAASAIADSVATTSPSVAVAIRTNLSNSVASHTFALLSEGDQQGDSTREAASSFVQRALHVAIADNSRDRSSENSDSARIAVASAPAEPTAQNGSSAQPALLKTSATINGAGTSEGGGVATATIAPATANATFAASLAPAPATLELQHANIAPFDGTALAVAVAHAEEQFNAASSTLSASTTAEIQTSLSNLRLLNVKVQADLSDGDQESARADSFRGLAGIVRIEALLKVHQPSTF